MMTSRPFRTVVFTLVAAGMLPGTSGNALAFSGGVTTVYTSPTATTIERARTFPAKTPELDQTYQRTMRTAATKAAVGTALRSTVRGMLGSVQVIAGLAILAADLYGIWTKRPDGSNDLKVPADKVCTVAPCSQYQFTASGGSGGAYVGGWFYSTESAARATMEVLPTEDGKYSYKFLRCEVVGYDNNCFYNITKRTYINEGYSNQTTEYSNYNTSGTIAKRAAAATVVDPNAPMRSLSDAELEDALKADKPFLPVLRQLDDAGQPVTFPQPEVEDMPSPIPITPSTVTHPDGSKTIEKTTLEPYRAADNSVAWRKNTEITEISKPDANGQTTSTTQTTTTDKGQSSTPEKAPEPPPTDSVLPGQPVLYKQKYPEGITGVWQKQRDLLANSPLFTLAKKLMPTVGLSGSCPTMPVNLSFSSWANYGVKDVAPPCQVWDWGRAICIVSACLLARRLIFGG